MKRLHLLRHAKSSWKDSSLDDFDRPLNKRGWRDAPVMGRRLATAGCRPDLMVTSPAKRALVTARAVAEALDYPPERVLPDETLYLASVPALLAVIRQLDDGLGSVLLCGHNPGLTDLLNALTDAGVDNVPTCGVASIELGAERWRDIAPGGGRLTRFDYPKKLAGG